MTSLPEWIEPMAATLTYERFAGPEWIFERKLDGIRLLAFKHGREVRLFSRNRLPQDVPAVASAIVKALRDGVEDVYPGDVAQEWFERWRENPKVLERELAAGAQ